MEKKIFRKISSSDEAMKIRMLKGNGLTKQEIIDYFENFRIRMTKELNEYMNLIFDNTKKEH